MKVIIKYLAGLKILDQFVLTYLFKWSSKTIELLDTLHLSLYWKLLAGNLVSQDSEVVLHFIEISQLGRIHNTWENPQKFSPETLKFSNLHKLEYSESKLAHKVPKSLK